jgi:hypothetical protein
VILSICKDSPAFPLVSLNDFIQRRWLDPYDLLPEESSVPKISKLSMHLGCKEGTGVTRVEGERAAQKNISGECDT